MTTLGTLRVAAARADLRPMAAHVRAIAMFCLECGGHLYPGWSAEKLFKYLAFQWMSGQLFVARDGPDILGVLIAWPDRAADIRARAVAGDLHFNWQRPIAAGDALMVADVITANRGPRYKTVLRLVQLASARWPDWKMRTIFTHRRGELVELPPGLIERFFHVTSRNS